MFDQNVSTLILVDAVKTLGLSEKTMVIIEQDIRNGKLRAEVENKKLYSDARKKQNE